MHLSSYKFNIIYRKVRDNKVACCFNDLNNQELPLLVNTLDTKSSFIKREKEKNFFCIKTIQKNN